MNVDEFLSDIRRDPSYADQIVHIHEESRREARYSGVGEPESPFLRSVLSSVGVDRLYSHQAEAVRLALSGENVVLATGTASGKTFGYALPILDTLHREPGSRALLLFPTKALAQDQFKNFRRLMENAGLQGALAGVYDGDTPGTLRRKLRDHGSAIFSNPDMLHAAVMPEHGRWADFFSRLKVVVLDELHVYSGIFGSNIKHVMTRLFRLCEHYGSSPQVIACSATIANPRELAEQLTGRSFRLVDRDGSPRGRRVTVFWNPPRIRQTTWRGRRSANVEAHELMAALIARGVPTITFSKAKMTAEMIHRYVCDTLRQSAPHLMRKVTPYRGGYLPQERREIEERLFSGELLGVSTTPALELGIDVGALEASIVVGYPGTLASFFQQSGRAGRRDADAVVFLIGLDTSINQYIMSEPDYVFSRSIEQAVIDPDNPFVAIGHVRCAAHELPLGTRETARFGPHADMALTVLQSNRKVTRIGDCWYHSAVETPQHEISLRDYADANVLIEDAATNAVLGEVNRFDAEPLLHPEAIYMHRGDTYRVLNLDLERNIATVKREEVDYYTQPLGGTDVHHIDHRLREKRFGTGTVCWGEVTAHFNTYAYEKINFYSLDAVSQHGLDLPIMVLETMAFWLIPPEELMARVRRAGLDAHSGLRGIGYATRMLLPLFMTCDTLDFSHTVGSVNSPWNAVFVYERYPHGLGFTEKAYERMHEILPVVYDNVGNCPCERGCPCCVGKPLRQRTTWNVERGEASIPSKAATLMILEGMIDSGENLRNPDGTDLTDTDAALRVRLERAVRRRLERMREPQVFHPITPQPEVETAYPEREADDTLETADVERRVQRRRDFDRDLHKRLAKKIRLDGLHPHTPPGKAPQHTGVPDASVRPQGMKRRGSNLAPTAFPGRPDSAAQPAPPGAVGRPAEPTASVGPPAPGAPRAGASPPIAAGDSLAARARRKKKREKRPPVDGNQHTNGQ
jgi:DEAD/DEAH box helicase domain-containing protein